MSVSWTARNSGVLPVEETRSDPHPRAQESTQKLLLLFLHPSPDTKKSPVSNFKDPPQFCRRIGSRPKDSRF
jgi:hypothetical protein